MTQFPAPLSLRTVLLTASVAVLSTSNATARVGETDKELVARFGEPWVRSKHQIVAQGKMWDLGSVLNFKQSDWHIGAIVVEGRCVSISYSKPGEWTEEQFQTVLSSNNQGASWSETSNPSLKKLQRSWRRNDGAIARWSNGAIQVTVPAYDRAKAVLEAKAKAAASQKPKI